jgi:SAM-dependent methyltransferase
VTRYLDRVMAGEQPTEAEWNEHLVAFHHAYTSVTPALMSQLRAPDGRTSYEVLAQRIKALVPNARDILDVGCGDGTLLRELERTFDSTISLTGVDLSEDELARGRAISSSVRFVRGEVSAIDLGRKSYDVVTSHLAFMAMSEIGKILAHTCGALRGDGMLIFVCEDPLAGGAMFGLIRGAIEHLRVRLNNFAPIVPRREAIEDNEVLWSLLREAGFGKARVERLSLRGALTEEQLWAFLERCYPLGMLEPALRSELRYAMHSRMHAIAASGSVAELPLRFVVATA